MSNDGFGWTWERRPKTGFLPLAVDHFRIYRFLLRTLNIPLYSILCGVLVTIRRCMHVRRFLLLL
jgi:hypothetical protein